MPAPLARREFRRFVGGKLVSNSGVWMFSTIVVVEAFQVTGSTLFVALVTTATFSPQIILAPLSGRWSDKGMAHAQAVGGRCVAAVGAGVLAVLMASALAGRPYQVMLVVTSALVGAGFAIGGPVLQSALTRLVPAADLPSAVALNGLATTLSRGIGPAVAGALLALGASPSAVVLVSASCQVVHAVILRSIPLGSAGRQDDGKYGGGSVLAALRLVTRDRRLGALLIAMAVVGAGAEPFTSLLPAIALSSAAVDDAGWLASSFGAGSVLTFFVIPALGRWMGLARTAMMGFVLLGIGLVLVSAASSLWLAQCGFAVAGSGFALASTNITTLIQLIAPAEVSGRVMAFWLVAFTGVRPIAALVGGLLADVASLSAALWASALVCLAATPCLFIRSRIFATESRSGARAAARRPGK